MEKVRGKRIEKKGLRLKMRVKEKGLQSGGKEASLQFKNLCYEGKESGR